MNQHDSLDWASDTRPSLPVPPQGSRLVPMGGFVFTANGLAHDLSVTDSEEMAVPPFAPLRMEG